MTYCGECGGELADHMTFCKECGTPRPPQRVEQPTASSDVSDTEVLPADTNILWQESWAEESPTQQLATDPVQASGPTLSPSPAPARTGWWRQRRARIAAAAFLVLALLGTGLVVGWFAGADRDLVKAERIPSAAAPSAAPTDEAGPSMPDVRGLAVNDARQILADAGISSRSVVVKDQPAAGESGLVLSQAPVYGSAVGDSVTLSRSSPAKVPSFSGRQATDVLADLDELGAEVTTRSKFVPGLAVGRVASIQPAPGTLLPVAVTVVVAAEPDRVDLSHVVAVEDSCSTDTDSLNGTTYDELLTCNSDSAPLTESWVIARAGSRLSGTLGIPDSSEPSERMSLEVVGDGRVLDSYTAAYGRTTPIDVNVSGVLRLTLRFRSLTEDYSTLGIANLRLLGDAAQLAKLPTDN